MSARFDAVIMELNTLADPDQLDGMSRYGMSTKARLGIKIPELRKIARKHKRDHELALELWSTGIAEARILAAMVDDPAKLTPMQMDEWAQGFDSWDVCDQVCMNLFDKSELAWTMIPQWAHRDEEFVKRAGYALIACLAWHDKKATDEQFLDQLPIIVYGATDERNYVKKGVSWALRHIGKRNRTLHTAALQTARNLLKMDSRSARWIGKDAERDLLSATTQKRMLSSA